MSDFPADDRSILIRRLAVVLLGVPLLILVAAYVAISVHHGTPLLWNVVVHEDGHRTLAQTVFYFEHTTRELPIDLFLGVMVGAAGAWALAPAHGDATGLSPGVTRLAVAALLAAVALMTIATAAQLGMGSLRDNLLQYHTREGAPLVWGAHWRYHLLERGPMLIAVFAFFGVLRALRPDRPGATRAGGVVIAVVAAYILVTAIFTPSLSALALPFVDTRYLGHELREILTHGLVTVPLGIGVVLLQAPRDVRFATRPGKDFAGALLSGLVALAAVAYVLVAAVLGGSATAGQSQSMVVLLAPHFFEHTFTYIVTPLTASIVFRWLIAPTRDRSRAGSFR